MESTGCYLALGLILGTLLTASLLQGNAKRKAAMSKIRALKAEEEKAKGIVTKARENRRQGCAELPVAYLFILLGIAVLLLAAYLMASGQAF
jgi:hypothetical protein